MPLNDKTDTFYDFQWILNMRTCLQQALIIQLKFDFVSMIIFHTLRKIKEKRRRKVISKEGKERKNMDERETKKRKK